MSRLRRLTIALVTFGLMTAAVPAFAQDTPPPGTAQDTPQLVLTTTPAPATAPTMKTMKLNPSHVSFAPASTTALAPRTRGQNEQGLGVFIQGGFIRMTTYGSNGLPPEGALETGLKGFILGIAFGGNKSGHFGIGADVNYIVVSNDNAQFFTEFFDPGPSGPLDLQYLQIPVYGRINFFGLETKNRPTLYALVGGYVDILLKAKLNETLNIKDSFNGFDAGVLVGVGFEAYRVGIEARFHWALTTLQSTGVNHDGEDTFLNGLEDTKKATFILLFRFRLH